MTARRRRVLELVLWAVAALLAANLARTILDDRDREMSDALSMKNKAVEEFEFERTRRALERGR